MSERYRILKTLTLVAWALLLAVLWWESFSRLELGLTGVFLVLTSNMSGLAHFHHVVTKQREELEREGRTGVPHEQDTTNAKGTTGSAYWPLEWALYGADAAATHGRHLKTGRALRRPLAFGWVFLMARVVAPLVFVTGILAVPANRLINGYAAMTLLAWSTNYLRHCSAWPFKAIVFRRFPRPGQSNVEDTAILAMVRLLGTHGLVTLVQSFPLVPTGWQAFRIRLERMIGPMVVPLLPVTVAESVEFVERTDAEWPTVVESALLDVDLAIVDVTDLSLNLAWELDVAVACLPPFRIFLIASDGFACLDTFSFPDRLTQVPIVLPRLNRIAFRNSFWGRAYLRVRLFTRLRLLRW